MINILIGNDDGIRSEGIARLVQAASRIGKAYVFAPREQQSGKSCSLSLNGSMQATVIDFSDAEMAYEIDGSPADCLKFGVAMLGRLGIGIDYVLTGINMGANLGIDVHYSGTVGSAMEGAMNGYKAIALSVAHHEAKYFDYICDRLPDFIKMSDELGPGYVLNVNSPDLPADEIEGLRIVPTGAKGFELTFTPTENEKDMYTVDGYGVDYTGSTEEHDITTIGAGYISVTPLRVDMTDMDAIKKLKNKFPTDNME